jgi:hypothetical protein
MSNRSLKKTIQPQMNADKIKFLGRVGEKVTPFGATPSPLVEPDVRISRIRLS